MVQLFVRFTVACIKAAIADHLKMFFRDMPDEPPDKFHSGESFFYISIIFMTVVMESDILPVIMVNAGGCDHRSSEISADIFDNGIGVAIVRFCINIEPVFILLVTEGFSALKGRSDFGFHFVKKCGTESVAQIVVVEMVDRFPKVVITKPALGNEAVDMRIPF